MMVPKPRTLLRTPATWATRLVRRSLKTGSDGWIFGHELDGAGGSKPLTPWDAAAVRRARDGKGAWVHLDFRAAQAQSFIASCARTRGKDHEVKRQIHISSLMCAEPRKEQPRCEVASNLGSMLLALRVNFGKRFVADVLSEKETSMVPFRLWLGRGIVITARGRQPDEGVLRMPTLSQALDCGHGPATCGALASAVISEITSITAESVEALEDEIFELKARLQQQALKAGAHRPVSTMVLQGLRSELMPLRYAAISMRRHEVPELNALHTVVRLSERPDQTLFSETDKYELREARARQEALVEGVIAAIEAGQTLQNEMAAHASWQQSDYSFQLTVLGCVLSVLGFCSISIDALTLIPMLRQGAISRCGDTNGTSTGRRAEPQLAMPSAAAEPVATARQELEDLDALSTYTSRGFNQRTGTR